LLNEWEGNGEIYWPLLLSGLIFQLSLIYQKRKHLLLLFVKAKLPKKQASFRGSYIMGLRFLCHLVVHFHLLLVSLLSPIDDLIMYLNGKHTTINYSIAWHYIRESENRLKSKYRMVWKPRLIYDVSLSCAAGLYLVVLLGPREATNVLVFGENFTFLRIRYRAVL